MHLQRLLLHTMRRYKVQQFLGICLTDLLSIPEYVDRSHIVRVILHIHVAVDIITQLVRAVGHASQFNSNISDKTLFRFHHQYGGKALRRHCLHITFFILPAAQWRFILLALLLKPGMYPHLVNFMQPFRPLGVKLFHGQQLTILQETLDILLHLGKSLRTGQRSRVTCKPSGKAVADCPEYPLNVTLYPGIIWQSPVILLNSDGAVKANRSIIKTTLLTVIPMYTCHFLRYIICAIIHIDISRHASGIMVQQL